MSDDIASDVLVIGCGAAGAATALEAAKLGLDVVVLTGAADPAESNSDYAQGGIVARPPGDSAQELAADIMAAGDGMCNPEAVRLLAEGIPAVMAYLVDELHVELSRGADGDLDYTQEAAHSRRRIAHADDATGHAITARMLEALTRQRRIRLAPRQTAVDLITTPHHALDPVSVYGEVECLGAYALDQQSGAVRRFLAPHTVLATGGAGQLYLHTTNPRVARGDGLAMAARAGAEIINAEYIQFHPTAFYHRDAERFLISESVRGEGAVLRRRDGTAFMREYHPDGDLAARDIVARAIHEEMLRSGAEYVLLDLTPLSVDPKIRFPTIYEKLLQFGVDITSQPVPVVPAAHYSCGGVKVDTWGRSSLRRLYAVGEVSCTGLHGANRLASTSLAEAVIWGQRAARDAAQRGEPLPPGMGDRIAVWHDEGLTEDTDPLLVIQDWMMIKSTMWNYAGIVRTGKRLQRAVADLGYLAHRVEQFYRETKLTDSMIGLRNGIAAAQIIARAALRNPVSRGCHYRKD
ncbi:MAG: L-aspartate oxidase [Armatimonadota bacterium]